LLNDILCCPRCAGALVDADGGYRCEKCAGQYPVFGRIPCLVDDAALWRTIWLRRLDDYTTTVEARVKELQREAGEDAHLLPRTRQRLMRIASGFAQQVDAITSLFEPLIILTMGIMVGALILSMLLAITSINDVAM